MKDSQSQVIDRSKLDWTAQLVSLRDLTKRLGIVHEAQALQLRLWPFAIDPNLEKTTSSVDMYKKVVRFDWVNTSLTSKDQKKIKPLEDSVKFLFGNDWAIVVFAENLLLYPVLKHGRKRSNRRGSGRKRNKGRPAKAKRK